MRKILGILPLLFPLSLISCGSLSGSYIKCVAVHDGDTFTLQGNKTIRLFGVDTPETSNQYNDFNPTNGIEALYGAEATDFTSNLILGKQVLYTHISNDTYGRDVARISINNKDLGIALVRAGLARVAYISVTPKDPFYTSDFAYYRALLDAQYLAYQEKLGV